MVLGTALLLSAVLQAGPCGAAAQTAPSAAEVRSANSMAEVIGLTKFADGTQPPTSLKLPAIANGDVIFKYMREHYPAELRTDSVKPDLAVVWICVDTLGKVSSPKLIGSSGNAQLDTLALQVVKLSQFNAALLDGRKTALWMAVPVELSPIAATTKLSNKELAKAPYFTPFDTAPELMNRQQIAEEMRANYPPKLRASGTGGVVVLWVFVDEKGGVKNALVRESGGYRELDDFALGIATLMRFNPATYNNVQVPVWISLPLRLRPN